MGERGDKERKTSGRLTNLGIETEGRATKCRCTIRWPVRGGIIYAKKNA